MLKRLRSCLSYLFCCCTRGSVNENPGMAKRKFNNNSPSEDNLEESRRKIKSHQPSFHPDNFGSPLKAYATRSNEQETSLQPVKATNIIFDQNTSSTIVSSQSNPTNLYCSDTKPNSPAWSQHLHEQLSLHTQHSPKPQQLMTPSQCSTFPREKDNRLSTPYQSSITGNGQNLPKVVPCAGRDQVTIQHSTSMDTR